MDVKEIQDLLKLINKSNLTDVEIEQKDFKLRVQRRLPENVTYNMVQPQQSLVQPVAPVAAAPVVAAPQPEEKAAAKEAPAKEASKEPEASNLHEVKAPIIGTFYRSPSPDKGPFVQVGDVVAKGQVLGIIEAMKLFNEIESDAAGRIVKVVAENAQPVEYDQPLFLIEPV